MCDWVCECTALTSRFQVKDKPTDNSLCIWGYGGKIIEVQRFFIGVFIDVLSEKFFFQCLINSLNTFWDSLFQVQEISDKREMASGNQGLSQDLGWLIKRVEIVIFSIFVCSLFFSSKKLFLMKTFKNSQLNCGMCQLYLTNQFS